HPFAFRLLQVRRATWLTPRMVRVTLGGEALAGFRSDAADDGTRLYFPPDPADTSWVPTVDGNTLIFLEDRPRPPGREYTPRRHDPDAGELDFPRGAVFAWAAGEAASITALRRHLLRERGLDPERMRMTGYWRRNIANYDHHQPLEE